MIFELWEKLLKARGGEELLSEGIMWLMLTGEILSEV